MTAGKRGGGRNARPALLVVTLAWAVAAVASPYLPKADSTVLERVSARSDLDRLEPLRRRLAANPRDLPVALELAQQFLRIGRAAGDPRFTAYAEGALLPWMGEADVPEPVLVLQATALQNQHQFSAAMALLDRAMQLNPRDPQVWLTRATIFALHNEAHAARQACARLTRTADTLVALTCLAGIDSRNGRLSDSYAALRQVFVDDARLAPELRVWILTQLADMAERLGDDVAARQYLLAALRTCPDDGFSRAAYADLLIRETRYAEAVELLQGREAQDNLLLRLAIAGQNLPGVAGRRWAEMYAARIQAAQRDGDTVHTRERAWFALDVQHDAARALNLAEQNWLQQREPADARIYWRAARAARSVPAAGTMREWFNATRYEDATLASPSVGPGGSPPPTVQR